jgi:hypothetical protein
MSRRSVGNNTTTTPRFARGTQSAAPVTRQSGPTGGFARREAIGGNSSPRFTSSAGSRWNGPTVRDGRSGNSHGRGDRGHDGKWSDGFRWGGDKKSAWRGSHGGSFRGDSCGRPFKHFKKSSCGKSGSFFIGTNLGGFYGCGTGALNYCAPFYPCGLPYYSSFAYPFFGASYVSDSVIVDPVVYEPPIVPLGVAPPVGYAAQDQSGMADVPDVAAILADGNRALDEGRLNEARAAFGRVLELDPNHPQGTLSYGIVSLALGNLGDASSALHDALGANPDLAQTSLDLRQRLGKSADFPALRRSLEDFAKAQADGSVAQFLLGFVQFFGGEPIAGRATLHRYVSANEGDTIVRRFVEGVDRVTPPDR